MQIEFLFWKYCQWSVCLIKIAEPSGQASRHRDPTLVTRPHIAIQIPITQHALFPLKKDNNNQAKRIPSLLLISHLSTRKTPAVPGPSGSPTFPILIALRLRPSIARGMSQAPLTVPPCVLSPQFHLPASHSRMPSCAINTNFVKQSNLSS